MTTTIPDTSPRGRRSRESPAARASAISIFALLLLTGCCRMTQPVSVDEAIDAYGRRGDKAYSEGRYRQAAEAWQKGLDAARKGRRSSDAARFLVGLSRVGEGLGQYDQALAEASAALEILGEDGDPAIRCMALMQKGLSFRRTARYSEARSYFDQALEIARRLNDPRLESESVRNIAALLQDQGQFEKSLAYYEDALGLARAHGDEMGEARCLNNLGTLFDDQADYPKALARHRESLALRRKLGDRAGEGKVLGNICITYTNLNQIDRALGNCKAALDIALDIGDQQRAANHLNNIGAIYRKMEQPRKALGYYRRALKIKRELSDTAGEAKTLNNLGETCWRLGKLDAAEDYLERSLAIKADIGDVSGQSASCQNLALLSSQRGQYAKAKIILHQGNISQQSRRQARADLAGLRRAELRLRLPFQARSGDTLRQTSPALDPGDPRASGRPRKKAASILPERQGSGLSACSRPSDPARPAAGGPAGRVPAQRGGILELPRHSRTPTTHRSTML